MKEIEWDEEANNFSEQMGLTPERGDLIFCTVVAAFYVAHEKVQKDEHGNVTDNKEASKVFINMLRESVKRIDIESPAELIYLGFKYDEVVEKIDKGMSGGLITWCRDMSNSTDDIDAIALALSITIKRY